MATPSPMNRGYASGLAANRAPTTGLAANRAPTTGLAAGAQPGGSFRPNLAPMNYGMARPAAAQSPQAAPMAQAAPMPSMPDTQNVQGPDFSNMFGSQPLPTPGSGAPMTQQPPSPFDPPPAYQPAPLPTLGQQNFNQPPPSPFGPQPLPFGGFRAEGGPVMPGQAYMVGERGPEMIVPQQPGMVVPNRALTLSPMNRAYGELPAVGENTRNMSRGGSLANRAVRQVGRSANDINRIAERMRRQGDPRAIMQLGMLEKNQQFSTARDDQNFERRKQMFDMGLQAQTARDQVQRGYQTQDQQQAEVQRQSMEEARRQWELQMYGMKTGEQAMRDERDRVQAEQDRQRKIEHGLKPVPVEGTSTPYFYDANGSIYSGGQPAAPPPEIPEGFTPQRVDSNGIVYGPDGGNQPPPPPKTQMEKDANGNIVSVVETVWNPKTGAYEYRRVRVVDANGDGKISQEEAQAQSGGGASSKYGATIQRLGE
jgi:hypothetical protein